MTTEEWDGRDRGDADSGTRWVPGVGDADSRTRTHLANERTFLAWLRTGLGLLTLGLAAAQFLSGPTVEGVSIVFPLSMSLVAGGMVLTVLAAFRFASARRQIEVGAYRQQTLAIVVATAIVVAIGAVALAVVLGLRAPRPL